MIRKVFLISDESEITAISDHLGRQRQIDIDIHFFPFKEVENDPDLGRFRDIGSIDFGIFDDETVLSWKLEDRALVGGRVLMGEDDVKKHKDFFEILFKRAVEYDRNRFIVIPIKDPGTKEFINRWPKYRAPYEEMDYALRSPNGWLYSLGSDASTCPYAAYDEGRLIGFSILVLDGQGNAELYVAIHPDEVGNRGKSYGTSLTRETLRKGFVELGLKNIHLKVRNDIPHRIRMYNKVGFKTIGNRTDIIEGKPVDFLTMSMSDDDYTARYGRAFVASNTWTGWQNG